MSDTSSHKMPETGAKSGAASGRLIKGVAGNFTHSTGVENGRGSGDLVVRIPKTQAKVSIKVNTRLIAEQREIERANEQNRRSGS
jgi:hypothetical protein